MTDYTEGGAVPVDDAAVDDPPTVDEVLELQRRDFPEQAATSTLQPGAVLRGRPEEAGDVSAGSTAVEPMTGPQRTYLDTLGRDAAADIPDDLTKAQASALIEQLQRTTGRGDAGGTRTDER